MMSILELIGWAFFAGCLFAAFVAPLAVLLWWLDRKSKSLSYRLALNEKG
ncbi:hypothetical protein [Falsiruegeria mediterranea]|nr:hypothetical protein [Falsiruegeria mediterranea]